MIGYTCLSDASRVVKPQQTAAESILNKVKENVKLQYTAQQHVDHDSRQNWISGKSWVGRHHSKLSDCTDYPHCRIK